MSPDITQYHGPCWETQWPVLYDTVEGVLELFLRMEIRSIPLLSLTGGPCRPSVSMATSWFLVLPTAISLLRSRTSFRTIV
jgi:hypothetical protein